MSNIKTIGIDIDDTITNTFEKAEEYLINHIEYISYDELYEGKTERAINFAKERLETIQRECLPKEHAIEVIKRLKDKGYKIIIITARGSELKYDHEKITKDYFKKYNIPYDDMIFSSINKGLDCKNNNIDILLLRFKNMQFFIFYLHKSIDKCKNMHIILIVMNIYMF